jgi:iron-sulfur cluster assembly accessory protein
MSLSFTVTERAGRRIAEIAAATAVPGLLRVAVDGGGCSGFQYRIELAKAEAADDAIVQQGGAKVLIDPVSAPYLEGAELDFVDDLIGASFKVKNPNAVSACGCGTSFSL